MVCISHPVVDRLNAVKRRGRVANLLNHLPCGESMTVLLRCVGEQGDRPTDQAFIIVQLAASERQGMTLQHVRKRSLEWTKLGSPPVTAANQDFEFML